jgi:hypothetical protein
MDSLATTLVDAQVDLNPHQIDGVIIRILRLRSAQCCNITKPASMVFPKPTSSAKITPFDNGFLQANKAASIWAERKRKILIITPANLRKQWHQELQEKFGLQGTILEAKSYNVIKKAGKNPFRHENPVICSYQFAKL